jgi:hypothetical protein
MNQFSVRLFFQLLIVLSISDGFIQKMRASDSNQPSSSEKNLIVKKIELQDHIVTLTANFSTQVYETWTKSLQSELESIFKSDHSNRDLLVQITFHKDKDADVELTSKPQLEDASRRRLIEQIKKGVILRSKVSNYTLRVFLQLNDGNDPAILSNWFPVLKTPGEQRLEKFSSSIALDRLQILKAWASQDVLPVLGEFMSSVDSKFEGVRGLGSLVKGIGYSKPVDIRKITDLNPNYWRALAEMEPKNTIVPTVTVFLFIVNGELDKAKRLAEAMMPFSGPKYLSTSLLKEFIGYDDIFRAGLNKEIEKGIFLHDKKQYNEAFATYKNILNHYPKSAWATYEYLYTKNTMDQYGKAVTNVKDASSVFECDPFYIINGFANRNDADAVHKDYLLLRRKDVAKLNPNSGKDIIEYADIALDIEEYGFAAQLYWEVLTQINREEFKDRGYEGLMEYFLFCVDKVGAQDFVTNFKGDHKTAFEKISSERLLFMENYMKTHKQMFQ